MALGPAVSLTDFMITMTEPDGSEVEIHVAWSEPGHCWVATSSEYNGPPDPVGTGLRIEDAVADWLHQVDED
jgi:hypothetical protein